MFEEIKKIAALIRENGGTAYLVGGCVRDQFLNLTPKDFDIECFGISPANLISLLGKNYNVDLVGESFGVIKLKNLPIDISLPRREKVTGSSHKDFEVVSDPFMSKEEAALRRDFTVNSLMFNPLTENYVDPTDRGIRDLTNKILDPVSEKFKEDSLRILRAMQFIARFNFSPSPRLLEYAAELNPTNLPSERLFEEWNKYILKGKNMFSGLMFLYDSGWAKYFPEIAAIKDVPQDIEHHPEQFVHFHSGYVLDAFAKNRTGDEKRDLVLGYSCLCHDFGKATHTEWNAEKAKYTSYGHEEAGEEPTRSFMGRLTNQSEFIDEIVSLVIHHLKPRLFYKEKSSKSAIRRLALKVNIENLCLINKFDQMGRPPKNPAAFPEVDWLLGLAADMGVKNEKPKNVVMGRHLIELGMKPGKEMGDLLNRLFQKQLDGEFSNLGEGLFLAKEIIEDEKHEKA